MPWDNHTSVLLATYQLPWKQVFYYLEESESRVLFFLENDIPGAIHFAIL